MGFLKANARENIVTFRVNLGMWHLKLIVLEKQNTVLRVSTHIYGVSHEIEMGNCSFLEMHKPRHVTHQINCLGNWKMSPVLRVSTHIYCVSKDKGGKTFIFQLNLGMWPLKLFVSEKRRNCSEGFNTYLWGFSWDRWTKCSFLE